MIIRAFKKEDLGGFDAQPHQQADLRRLSDEDIDVVAQAETFTLWHPEHGAVAVIGFIPIWPGHRAWAWSFLSTRAGKCMAAITRAAEDLMLATEYRFIEATVADGFEQGHRWLKLLGFHAIAPHITGWLPDGRDGAHYMRVQ